MDVNDRRLWLLAAVCYMAGVSTGVAVGLILARLVLRLLVCSP